MKKCPKCKAEIQEEARFCLYCMTSFEEKQAIETPKENNKRWLIIIAAVLVLVLIFLGIFLFAKKDKPNNGDVDTSSILSINSDFDAPEDNNTTSIEQQNSVPQREETSASTSSNQAQASSQNVGSTTNNATTSSTSTNSTSSSNKAEGNSPESGSSTPTTTTPSQTATATYIYRDAKYGDDFSVSADLENAVVIIGVKTASTDGEYIIPETIDGKRVVAIMALAFCDDGISNTVKTVVVPSSVRTIWNNAFASCYNLTDIYFKGNSIYTESNAFPEASKRNGTLTIHCSSNCSDRNYRYYKNSALYYDAEYKEWNG